MLSHIGVSMPFRVLALVSTTPHHGEAIRIVSNRPTLIPHKHAHNVSPSASELEREANIARNKALLQQLELKQAVESLPSSSKVKAEKKAKPIPLKTREKRKREPEPEAPRRQSARLRRGQTAIDPNESPRKRAKREVRDYDVPACGRC